jgi:hypothetical protein
MRWFLVIVAVACCASVASLAPAANERHVNATFSSVNGSGITGRVELTGLPQGGTLITIVAQGLRPDTRYLSLYYDNTTCEIEAYEEDDVIGHYTANGGGTATLTKKVEDDLDEIGSVSVRLEEGFTLQACAVVPH